ncbi:MAG: hypothetical protein RIA63_01235, partial [Cyclobacteriaceae bacterium]
QKYVRDQDKNLIRKNTYTYALNPSPQLTSTITGPTYVYDLTPATFTCSESCIDGVTYEWRVGTGSWQETGFEFTPSFSSVGAKSIQLRLTHPLYDPVIISKTTTVVLEDFSATSCAKGAEYINCTSVTSSYSCSSITSPVYSYETTYKITGYSVSGTETITSYEWKVTYDNEFYPVTVGTAESVTVDALVEGEIKGYTIECVMYTNTGRKGTVTRNGVSFTPCS